jgi:hypothetical protein
MIRSTSVLYRAVSPDPLALAGRSSLELGSVTNVTNQTTSRRTASHVAGGGGSRSICHAFPDLDSHSVLLL